MRHCWMALVLAGCAGEAQAPRVEPEPTPPAEEPAEERVETSEVAPAREEPIFTLPESGEVPAITQLPNRTIERHLASWPVIRHPDPIVTARLGVLLGETVRYLGKAALEPGDDAYAREMDGADCSVVLATERVVSIVCESRDYPERAGGPMVEVSSMHFAIRGSEVRPFAWTEAFSRELDLVALLQARCDGLARRTLRSGDEEHQSCDLARAAYALGPEGLVSAHPFDRIFGPRPRILRTTIPYAELRDAIRPDGPLAWVFAERTPPASPAPDRPNGWVVSEIAPLPELAARWGRLAPEMRAELALAPRGQGTGQLVVASDDRARADRLASALGGSAMPARLEAPLTLAAMRTRSDLTIRVGVGTSTYARAVVPRGTRLVAIRGEHDRTGTAPTNRQRAPREPWTQVVLAEELFGFVSERTLAPDEECAPSTETFLAGFGADRDAARAKLVVAHIDVRRNGTRSDAVLMAASGGGATRIAVYALGTDCALGDVVIERHTRGALRDIRVGTTAHRSGDTLVLAATEGRTPELMMVEVLHAGSREAVFEHEVEIHVDESPEGVVAMGATENGTYWPLVVHGLNPPFYAWDGTRLVVAELP